MGYFLGIDGGGTKTKLIVINENNDIIYEKTTGPSSVDTVSSKETFQAFEEGLKELKLEHKGVTFKAVFAGLGGIVYDSQKDIVRDLIYKLSQVNKDTVVRVENDMHNALYSGLLFDEGMTLISGTGMVAYGKDLLGNEAKCGGWGFKEGDLGSGYSLGVSAIRHMIRCYDGRIEMDEFAVDVANVFNLKQDTDIINILDKHFLDRTKIASLAPIVTKHANANNEYALKIIDGATDELALSINGIYKKLTLKEKKLVIVGTLGNIDGQFKKYLHQKIYNINKDINIIAPIVDPALAASLMAKNLIE